MQLALHPETKRPKTLKADSGHRAYFRECLKLGGKLPFSTGTCPSLGTRLSLFHN
jgi:hypothetical protein